MAKQGSHTASKRHIERYSMLVRRHRPKPGALAVEPSMLKISLLVSETIGLDRGKDPPMKLDMDGNSRAMVSQRGGCQWRLLERWVDRGDYC
jgi:hypothetical protein